MYRRQGDSGKTHGLRDGLVIPISVSGLTERNGLRTRLASDPVDFYWTSGSEAIILSLSRIPCKSKTGNAMLTEAQWRRIYAFLCAHVGVYAFKEAHCRLFVEAVCWMARNDASWRMLPAEYGKWNSIYHRYAAWEKKGIWQALREHVQEDADLSALLQKSAIGREQYPGARS